MSKVVVLWASLFVACAPLAPCVHCVSCVLAWSLCVVCTPLPLQVSTVYYVYWPGPSILHVLILYEHVHCGHVRHVYGKIPLSTSKSAKNTFCEHAICAITLSTSKSAKTTFNSCDHRLLNDMQLTMNSFFSQQDPRGGN